MTSIYLNGKTPQKVIKMMQDIINRTKGIDKERLLIEEYEETYNDPFCQSPDKLLRVVVKQKSPAD